MIRPVEVVVAALRLVCPGQSDATLEDWGAHVRQLGITNGHDPVTQVAILENESRCNPRAFLKRGALEVVGLMGINLANFPACRDTSATECEAMRAQLLEPRFNLTMGSQYIAINRAFCKDKTGRGMFENWLASYQGFNVPSANRYCALQRIGGRWVETGVPKLTRKVMRRRREILRKVGAR